jgi:hypothetical protein
MTLFVFNKRFDYSEYAQMVERRQLPEGWNGHWRYNVVDAYGCILAPEADEYSLGALVAQQMAGAYLDSVGRTPAWFSQGSAWALAARVDPRDPTFKAFKDQVPAIMSQMKKADDFLTGNLPTGDAAVLNFGFAEYLLSSAGNYGKLLAALKKGVPFDQALRQSYGGDASQLAASWALKVARGKRS